MPFKAGISLILMLACSSLQAEIYRSQDSDGNTVFSDKAANGAEVVELNTAPYRYKVELKRVIDGDTLLLKSGEKVRLIGINTPEVESRFSQPQPGGEAAKNWLKKTLRTPFVWLEYDEQAFDKYERRLAHVFLESGEYVNAMLLEQGQAMLTLIPPNLRYAKRLITAQTKAEQDRRGVWQLPAYQLQAADNLKPGTDHRGWQRWQLTPKVVGAGRKYVNLMVSEHLRIMIPKARLALFPPLENYLDKSLEVRGWMRRQGSQHHIMVQHPSAIIVY